MIHLKSSSFLSDPAVSGCDAHTLTNMILLQYGQVCNELIISLSLTWRPGINLE